MVGFPTPASRAIPSIVSAEKPSCFTRRRAVARIAWRALVLRGRPALRPPAEVSVCMARYPLFSSSISLDKTLRNVLYLYCVTKRNVFTQECESDAAHSRTGKEHSCRNMPSSFFIGSKDHAIETSTYMELTGQ